jgi:hypothetical protein
MAFGVRVRLGFGGNKGAGKRVVASLLYSLLWADIGKLLRGEIGWLLGSAHATQIGGGKHLLGIGHRVIRGRLRGRLAGVWRGED